MPKSKIEYSLLLSCPGDVVDLKDAINDAVNSFNSSIGETNHITVVLKHWSTDSYPQSGDTPQNILNKQFINDCDFCVALFGTRFGTPTDNSDSGTEDEIKNMLSSKKQVFLYLIDRDVKPSDINLEQYAKVKHFMEKYKDKVLFGIAKTKEDLRTKFQNALSLYFRNEISVNSQSIVSKNAPNLAISFFPDNKAKLQQFNFCGSLVLEIQNEIISLINRIKKININSETNMDNVAPCSGIFTKEQFEKINRFYETNTLKLTKVEILAKNKSIVEEFCSKQGISLDDGFWNLGNLREQRIVILGQNDNGLRGQKNEKDKFLMLTKLITLINNYNDMHHFFGTIDEYVYASLFVSNDGTTFDEDIDIKLYIEKNTIVRPNDIPIPGNSILEMAVSDSFPSILFTDEKTPEIDAYCDYQYMPKISSIASFYGTDYTEHIKELRRDYSNEISSIFCYDIRENEKEDVLCLNIQYLKQHKKMFFPSRLLFKKAPKSIKYEINSNRSPEVSRGELIIE